MSSKSSRVIPRIFGGLGNQLFIYAASRRLALVSEAELILDDVSGFERDVQYHRHYQLDHFHIPCRKATAAERLEPFSRLRRSLKRRWNQRLPFEQRTYLAQEGIDFDPRILNLRVQGTLYTEGYWQSEQYFKDVEAIIRQDLRIHPPQDGANLATAEHIARRNSVGLHMRFFDRPGTEGSSNAPSNYYQRAVAVIESRVSDAHYYLFSDQPEAARAQIAIPDDRLTVVRHNRGDQNAYADLWLMTQCQHFIIANSTFSWWGAWLSTNARKTVVAPGFELREGSSWWGFEGLLPEEWTKIT